MADIPLRNYCCTNHTCQVHSIASVVSQSNLVPTIALVDKHTDMQPTDPMSAVWLRAIETDQQQPTGPYGLGGLQLFFILSKLLVSRTTFRRSTTL